MSISKDRTVCELLRLSITAASKFEVEASRLLISHSILVLLFNVPQHFVSRLRVRTACLAVTMWLCCQHTNDDQQELQRISKLTLSLRERLFRPENASVAEVIAKIDDLAAIRGKRLVVEFHQADKDGSGGVSDTENRCARDFVYESMPQRVDSQL